MIRPFAFALLVGFFSGVYSTIFIASPVILFWEKGAMEAKRRLQKAEYRSQKSERSVPRQNEAHEVDTETVPRTSALRPLIPGSNQARSTQMPSELPKRWILKEADEGIVERQSEQAKISPLLARLLVLRGLADLDSAKRYLSSSLRSDLPVTFYHDRYGAGGGTDRPCNQATATHRHLGRLRRRWHDGASVLVSFLREIGAEPIYHVPHRIEEGYGLNIEGLRRLRERGASLVVTVDCGISNAGEIDAARDFGLDVVVVDHHQPPDELPPAVAVINPHRRGLPVSG